MPVHASGSSHASASALASRGIVDRHCGSRRLASPDGPPASGFLIAAAWNAAIDPPTWSSNAATVYRRTRRRPLERVVRNRLDEPGQPLGGGMEINR